jgi:cytochrome c'
MKPRMLVALLGVSALAACQRSATTESTPTVSATATPITSSSGISEAQQALDRLDTRVAVPLLPMMANHQKQDMRDHLLAVQEIILAAGSDDFAGVEHAAGKMGYSEEMGQMCTHMGAGAPGFTEQAINFHHMADTITTAARQHDRAAVMRALGSTLQTCTGCHETFRQSVVDEATWNRLTSIPAPNGHAPSSPAESRGSP